MDIDLDWYTYLTEDFKLHRSQYRTAHKAVVDCPKCNETQVIRINHLKAKIKKLDLIRMTYHPRTKKGDPGALASKFGGIPDLHFEEKWPALLEYSCQHQVHKRLNPLPKRNSVYSWRQFRWQYWLTR